MWCFPPSNRQEITISEQETHLFESPGSSKQQLKTAAWDSTSSAQVASRMLAGGSPGGIISGLQETSLPEVWATLQNRMQAASAGQLAQESCS